MQIKYTNRLSFLIVSEKNKISYCTEGKSHAHTHLES
jgi:hypothetical protein